MRLNFCPECHLTLNCEDLCSEYSLLRSSPAETYVEKLLETVISPDSTRVGMAIDMLTKWLHEPHTTVSLLILQQGDVDMHRIVMSAHSLGWLGDRVLIPALVNLLFNQAQPFMARMAAAQALGQLGGEPAEIALQQATTDERPSVAQAAAQALKEMARSNEIAVGNG